MCCCWLRVQQVRLILRERQKGRVCDGTASAELHGYTSAGSLTTSTFVIGHRTLLNTTPQHRADLQRILVAHHTSSAPTSQSKATVYCASMLQPRFFLSPPSPRSRRKRAKSSSAAAAGAHPLNVLLSTCVTNSCINFVFAKQAYTTAVRTAPWCRRRVCRCGRTRCHGNHVLSVS